MSIADGQVLSTSKCRILTLDMLSEEATYPRELPEILSSRSAKSCIECEFASLKQAIGGRTFETRANLFPSFGILARHHQESAKSLTAIGLAIPAMAIGLNVLYAVQAQRYAR